LPVSHDRKPRNKWRRLKNARSTRKFVVMSRRSFQRVRLRRDYIVACLLDENTRTVLALEGKNWRWFECQDRRQKAEIRKVAGELLKAQLADAGEEMLLEAAQ